MKLLFEHIPKTGGLAIHGALTAMLPEGAVSPHAHMHASGGPTLDPSQFRNWPVLCGHFGPDHIRLVPDLADRALCTVIRAPEERVSSIFHYWRMIGPESLDYTLPNVEAARCLSLAAFIRDERVVDAISNSQSWFLGSNLNNDPETAARGTLDRIAVVGLTDDIPRFLDRMIEIVGIEPRCSTQQALCLAPRNSSVKQEAFSPHDLDHIREINQHDYALYSLARAMVMLGKT